MLVGILNIDLFIPNSTSLKEKRYAIKSIKDRLRHRYNVSVAEIDYTDKWQRATIGVAIVSNESRYIESVLGKAMNLVYGDHRVEVVNSNITYY